jgi:hypothetical protein
MLRHALLAAGIAGGLLLPAHAQGIRRGRELPPRAVKPELEPFAAEGTLRAVMPGRIQMVTDSTQNWLVLIGPKAAIHVTGTAEPDFLKAGMFIRFTAEVDRRGQAKGELKQLTIFTPSAQEFPGIWPEGQEPAGDKRQEGKRRFGSGIADHPPAGELSASDVYTVAGRITKCRKGRLTVDTGRAAVQAQVAQDAKIDVDFADYRVAKPGDRISITRGKMFAGRIGFAQAQELTIRLSEPLALPKKKAVRKKPAAKKSPAQPPTKEVPRPEPPDAPE